MARPKNPKLERAWRQRLQRQTSSGLSIPEFCAREGVSCSAFYAWKRRLTTRALPTRPDPPRFVPLLLDPHSHPVGQAPTAAVEIELPHHVRLRFDAPPEPKWLGRLVAALAPSPCSEDTP